MIITSDDALANFPEVQPLLTSRYRVIEREQWNTVWLRDDDSLTTSPRECIWCVMRSVAASLGCT